MPAIKRAARRERTDSGIEAEDGRIDSLREISNGLSAINACLANILPTQVGYQDLKNERNIRVVAMKKPVNLLV